MASSLTFLLLSSLVIFSLTSHAFSASLLPYFYYKVCPKALPTIKRIVQDAVRQERRMGASILRLHFHDCFVNVSLFSCTHSFWLAIILLRVVCY